jgi:hypothetical protein
MRVAVRLRAFPTLVWMLVMLVMCVQVLVLRGRVLVLEDVGSADGHSRIARPLDTTTRRPSSRRSRTDRSRCRPRRRRASRPTSEGIDMPAAMPPAMISPPARTTHWHFMLQDTI